MTIRFNGKRLSMLRKNQGFTLEGFATAIGSGKSYVWNLENEENPRPSGKAIVMISNVLGAPCQYFYDIDNVEKSKKTRKITGSSKGRTSDFESDNGGSIPSPVAKN